MICVELISQKVSVNKSGTKHPPFPRALLKSSLPGPLQRPSRLNKLLPTRVGREGGSRLVSAVTADNICFHCIMFQLLEIIKILFSFVETKINFSWEKKRCTYLWTILYTIIDLVSFFKGLSTIVGYLMPDPVYTYILNIYDLVWMGFMPYQPL